MICRQRDSTTASPFPHALMRYLATAGHLHSSVIPVTRESMRIIGDKHQRQCTCNAENWRQTKDVLPAIPQNNNVSRKTINLGVHHLLMMPKMKDHKPFSSPKLGLAMINVNAQASQAILNQLLWMTPHPMAVLHDGWQSYQLA